MTEGDKKGVVGMEWWSQVVRRADGEVVWRPKVPIE